MSDGIATAWWRPPHSRDTWPDPDGVSSALVETMAEPFYVCDRRGRLLEWNDAFQSLTGYSDGELADVSAVALVAEADLPDAAESLARVADGESETFEVRFETKEGERVPLELAVTPLSDDEGVWGLVGTARDVSERAERRKELERCEQLVETVGDGMYVLDSDGRIEVANDALADLLGTERDALLGTRFVEHVTAATARKAVRRWQLLERSDREVAVFEGELVRADGETVPIEGRFSTSTGESGVQAMGLVQDVSDRRERAQLLERLHEGTRELMAAETPREVAEAAVEVAHEHFQYATNAVRLVRDGELETVAVTTDGEDIEQRPPSQPVGEGYIGETYERGEPRIFPDVSDVEKDFEYQLIRSVIILPIAGWGTLGIGARERDAFDETDLELARLFASNVKQAFERADREQRVREQNADLEQYERLVETMGDGVYMTDDQSRFTAVNDAFVELVGYDREELLGSHVDVVSDGAGPDGGLQTEVRETGRSVVAHETAVVTAEGDRIPVENRFAPLPGENFEGTVGVVRDITERKRREEALQYYKEYTDDVLDAIDDVFYVIDEDANPKRWNESLTEVTGYTDDDIAGMHALDFFPADERPRIADAITEVFETGTARIESAFLTKDGERIPFEFVADRLEDIDGNPVVTGTARDISERVEKERQLSRLFSNVPGFVYRTSNDPGWPTEFVSEGVRDIAGYDPEEIEGEAVTWADDVMVDDPEEVHDQIAAAVDEGDPYRLVYAIETRDGDRRWVQSQGRGIYAADGSAEGIEGVVIDITERVEYERELERTRALLEQSQNLAQVGAWEIPVVDGEPAGLIATDEAYRIHEVPPETEATIEETLATFHPEDRDRVREALCRAIDQGEGYDMEVRLRTANGHERWVRTIVDPVTEDRDGLCGGDRSHAGDGEVVAVRGSIQDITARKRREEQLRSVTERLDLALEGAELGIWDWTVPTGELAFDDRWAEMLGYDADAVPTDLGTWKGLVHPSDRDRAEDRLQELLTDGSEYAQLDHRVRTARDNWKWVRSIGRVVERDDDGAPVRAVGVSRDITVQKEREAQLRTQRDELETLNRINELVQETIGALASAASREEIERTVCEHLGGSSLYRFAFTGIKPPGGGYTQPQTWAGEGASYLEEVEIPADSDVEDAGPVARTFETGEITVAHDVESDPLFEPFRETMLDYGFRSVAVVPFTHGDVVHGILAVYADRPGAFSQREVKAFQVLGEMVGFTISATQDRRLIEAEAPVEVTFEVAGDESTLATLADRLDAPCRLLGTAAASDSGSLHYVAVEGVTAEDVTVATEGLDGGLADARHVRSDGDEVVFEMRLAESIPEVLRNSGVRPTDVVVHDGRLEVVAEAPRDADIRTLTDRLDSTHGDASLVSKRERDSWRDSPATMREEVLDSLTERQRATVVAAYFAGYYDWPRDSTAEELADSLGVSSPTVHQHLRHAHRKILSVLLRDADQIDLDS